MDKRKFFSIPALVLAVICFIMPIIPGFYKYRSVSSSRVGSSSSSSKGAFTDVSCFAKTPVLGVLAIIFILVIVGLIIAYLASKNEKVSKAIKYVIFADFSFNIVVFIVGSCALSTSKTSGVPGAWQSTGTSWEFGGAGWAYMILSIAFHVCAFLFSNAESYRISPTLAAAIASSGTITIAANHVDGGDGRKFEFKQDHLLITYISGSLKDCQIKIPYSDISEVKVDDITDKDNGSVIFFHIYTKNKTLFRASIGGEWTASSVGYAFSSVRNINSVVKDEFFKVRDRLKEEVDKYKGGDLYQEEKKEKEEIESSEFMISFKKKYKKSFADFMGDFYVYQFAKTSLPKSNDIASRLESYAFGYSMKNRKYFAFKLYRDENYQIIKKTLLPEQELLMGNGLLNDRVASLVKSTSFASFDKCLYSLDDIISIKELDVTYHDNMPSFTYKKRPSALSLAIQSEFIHPMYAVGSVLEYQESLANGNQVRTTQETYLELLLKTHPLHKIYLDVKYFDPSHKFSEYIHELEVNEVEEKKANNKTETETKPKVEKTKAEKLKELKELLDEGLITQEDFDKAKQEILTQ